VSKVLFRDIPNFFSCLTPARWDGDVADPLETRSYSHVLSCQIWLLQIKPFGHILGMLGPAPLGWMAWLTLENSLGPTHVTIPNSVAWGQTIWV